MKVPHNVWDTTFTSTAIVMATIGYRYGSAIIIELHAE
jgi:hypothetical protein